LQLWKEQIAAFTFPRWHELPEIDLYMDQVVGYLSQKLAVFYDTDDDRRSITATMINNYVKQRIVQPPVKKRYSRAAVSSLMVLFCAKQVLSIGLCGALIAQCRGEGAGDEGAADFHDRFCRIFESVLHHTVAGDEDSTYLSDLRREDITLTATAIAFANQNFAERLILQNTAAETAPNNKEKEMTGNE
ncbi:MAG: DUF1836 domain-containing protein, partial [Clostridia bacterium]|nr:DUF1836 domain-containing protein [Clostridia bacterium]